MQRILCGGFAILAATATSIALAASGLQPAAAGHAPKTSTAAALDARGAKSIVDTAIGAGKFTTLVKALGAADLVGALQGAGPFTVFAPSDEAFAKLPAGTLASLLEPKNAAQLAAILSYHVVPGETRAAKVAGMKSAPTLNGQRLAISASDAGVRVAGASVVTTDIACSNGVIHVVDAVLMPSTLDLVATATAAGSFKTLAAALRAAGLVDALSKGGPFTVFAPTDEAFAKLPKGTLDELLKPENAGKLARILKHHVVEKRVYSDQLSSMSVATLAGTRLAIEVPKTGATIGGAGVQKADIDASNGVIHVIDRVLLPAD